MVERIVDLTEEDVDIIDQLAQILLTGFAEFSPGWLVDVDDAVEEISESLEAGRRSRVLLNGSDDVLGWIAAFEDDHCWEIHPLVVAQDHQRKGYGAMLVEDMAGLAREAGAVSIWAGTGDETGATSLWDANLYDEPLLAMANLTAAPGHPVHFWRKMNFTLVGILPDEEGLGRPGIHFARRIVSGG